MAWFRARSLDARIEQRDSIEAELAAWCADQDAFDLADRLQRAGVPSYPVLRPTDLFEDPQLQHRGFFVTLDHPVMGPTPYDGPLTRVFANARAAAPPRTVAWATQSGDPRLVEVVGSAANDAQRIARAHIRPTRPVPEIHQAEFRCESGKARVLA